MKIDKYTWCGIVSWSMYLTLFPLILVLYFLYLLGKNAEKLHEIIRKPQYKMDYKWRNRHYYRKLALTAAIDGDKVIEHEETNDTTND